MSKLCLLLLLCTTLFKANGQAGSLDSSFGNNGIQTTAFFNNINLLSEEGRDVLTNASGDIFVVILANHFTRIVRYLPNGKVDSTYGNAGYSDAVDLYVVSAAFQKDKVIVAGFTDNPANGTSDFALARYTEDGMLDSSFGENGMVLTDVDSSNDAATSIALSEGKIIVAGYTVKNFTSDFALTCYTADGALDSSFGEHGRVITDLGSNINIAYSVALQGDKVIVGGNTDNPVNSSRDVSLVRYTSNGTLDSSFGENGKVITDFYSDDVASSITLHGDMILVGGYTDNPANGTDDFLLARYSSDGTLDSSFGENGKVSTDFSGYDDRALSIALQGDKIIVAGYTFLTNSTTQFALTRFTADGILDSAFGENGKVITDFKEFSGDGAVSIALQEDKIVLTGAINNSVNSNYDFALTRFTADGTLDSSFGEKGLQTGYIALTINFFSSTTIQGDKIIAAGNALNDNKQYDFVLARFTADGTLDSSFGEHGKVVTDLNNSSDYANSVALQGDKIIVGGFSEGAGPADFALARYTADGRLDSSFGVNGRITTDFYNSFDNAYSIVLQGNKILVGGETNNPVKNNADFVLARYTADGALDSSFGEHGKVTTDFSNTTDGASSIALQGSKIIMAGNTYNPVNGTTDFALVRYTADGILDASFGENGKVTTDFNGYYDQARSIALQGDKIIAAGLTVGASFSNGDFALARYTADGRLDSTFGEHGKVTTDFSNSGEVANSVALQGDKVIVGGVTYNPVNGISDFALVRYTAKGKLDAFFGEHGKVISNLGGASSIQGIALCQDRLYAVGSLTLLTGDIYGVVAAYQLETPGPAISIEDVTVLESKKLAVVTVRLSAPVTRLVRVNYTTRNKTAVYPNDYIPVKGTLLFAPGLNRTAKVFIPIVDDNINEATEQFEVLLTKAWNATIHDSVGVVTILDNDAALITKQHTSLQLNVSPNPSAGAFTIQLKGSNLKQQVSVRVYDVSGRLLEERNNITIGQSIRLGDRYKAGIYMIEALQGSRSVQTKVIKTGK